MVNIQGYGLLQAEEQAVNTAGQRGGRSMLQPGVKSQADQERGNDPTLSVRNLLIQPVDPVLRSW